MKNLSGYWTGEATGTNKAGFAIRLITPDDCGYPKGKEEEVKQRARQNVILEL